MTDFASMDTKIDNWKNEMVLTLTELLSIQSIQSEPCEGAPFGRGISEALNFMLSLCKGEDFETKDGEGFYGYADYACVEARESDKMLGIFTHVDVVPSGDGWSEDPFKACVKEGNIIARGSMDDKGPLIAAFYALKALKETKIKLNSKIRLFFGCDEESSFSCISKYVKTERIPDFTVVADANYPVTYAEKGLLSFEMSQKFLSPNPSNIVLTFLRGGEKENIVPGSCEALLKVEDTGRQDIWEKYNLFGFKDRMELEEKEKDILCLKTRGIKAHASLAKEGLSAISLMMMFLDTLNMRGDVGDFCKFYTSEVGLKCDGSVLGIGIHDTRSEEISVNLGLVEYRGEEIKFKIDIRYPHWMTSNKIMENIKALLDSKKIQIKDISDFLPMHCPKDSFLVQTLLRVYNGYYLSNEEPVSIGSSTYAHNMPNAVAFGPNHPGQIKLAHKADEYIEIQNLIDTTKLYARAIIALDHI